ncbi:NAD(P)-dependent oxidoreductase [Spirosoma endophyticum]|uniref:Putative NADH-flavin reductase n=1 Tax=Spirosoma endophyticum TaxID=662367 RepID=A0A1I1HH55_9BACT|nr:NAD(P)H-binding protein [Spirosoma endophyticum]SFC23171.1 Putative NADH-flavin reductase [Spirosoma endophyticum]
MSKNILIFGATGLLGRHLVKASLKAGHTVSVYIRQADYSEPTVTVIQGELSDEQKISDAVQGADIIISSVGNRDYADPTKVVAPLAKQLAKAVRESQRLILISGSGLTLHNHNTLRRDLPGQPAFLKHQREDHWEAYTHVAPLDIDYLFVCPTMIVDGEADGAYLAQEIYFPASTQKQITAGNVARFVVDELRQNRYHQTRVGLATQ